MACFRGNREEFYGEVLLLDERKITLAAERGIKKSSKAAAILQQVFSHLRLVEVEFFGLRFCDNKQQTNWLDPSKTLSQHRDLIGPPYIFYFGVKFYAEDPSKLKEETTRYQFYLQVCQDVRRGRLPVPAHLRPCLAALMLLAEQEDYSELKFDPEENQEIQHVYKTLSGVSRHVVQRHFLSLCSSLQMFGVSLFVAYGENQTEYFLGPTPVGVVIYKNKVLVGKYFWQRIIKLHFKDETFELRVSGKRDTETSFFFQTSDRSDCKRLWKCCVQHHVFFRMSRPSTHTLKQDRGTPGKHRHPQHDVYCQASLGVPAFCVNYTWKGGDASLCVNQHQRRTGESIACSPTLALPQLNIAGLRIKSINNKTADVCMRMKHRTNQTSRVTSEPIRMQTAPSAVHRSEGGAKQGHVKPSAPWENSGSLRGLFNLKFPPNTEEEEEDGKGGRPQRRSRSLDGERPMRQEVYIGYRRSRSHGNTSSGSESEKTASHSTRCKRRTKKRSDSTCRCRARSRSPGALAWKHIQKQLVEPDGLMERQTEEIPYKEVRVSEQIRMHRSPRGRRHHRWASATDLHSKIELVPPLPVTKATDTSC